MADELYADAAIPVRSDIDEAHRYLWQRISAPGTWWSGRERLAMAAESRLASECGLCRERRQALSPESASGEHDHGGELPAPLVEVVHRLRTDSGRLTKRWLEARLAEGLRDAEYVECVGVVVRSIGMDAFARAVGVAPFSLPGPAQGEPSRRRPDYAKDEGAWVPMISQADAHGPEADLYPDAAYFPNVGRALSLVPDEVRDCRRLLASHYLDFHQVIDPRNQRSLARPQAELLGTRVSALHDCFY